MAALPDGLTNGLSDLAISQSNAMTGTPELPDSKISWTIFQTLSWDAIEEVFHALGPDQAAIFARTCRLHYSLAHGYLWRMPTLSLTQAQKFLGFLYRRPLVTASLPPHLAKGLEQVERPETVKRVELRYYLEEEYMDEIMMDTVVRLVKFCPEAQIMIGIILDRTHKWQKMITGLSPRVSIVSYEELSPGRFVTKDQAEKERRSQIRLPMQSAMIVIAHVTGQVVT